MVTVNYWNLKCIVPLSKQASKIRCPRRGLPVKPGGTTQNLLTFPTTGSSFPSLSLPEIKTRTKITRKVPGSPKQSGSPKQKWAKTDKWSWTFHDLSNDSNNILQIWLHPNSDIEKKQGPFSPNLTAGHHNHLDNVFLKLFSTQVQGGTWPYCNIYIFENNVVNF